MEFGVLIVRLISLLRAPFAPYSTPAPRKLYSIHSTPTPLQLQMKLLNAANDIGIPPALRRERERRPNDSREFDSLRERRRVQGSRVETTNVGKLLNTNRTNVTIDRSKLMGYLEESK